MSDLPTHHFISQVHWDREWVTSFEESRTLFCDFMDALFDVLESDPAFTGFILDGQMAVLLDYLEIRPDRKTLVATHVQDRRLFIGPWWVLADEFLPSGESHIRNLLYGLRSARQFGQPMMVGYLPDQFGHIAQMPQILRGFGIDSAVIYRGFGGEPGQESSEYHWRSPDGSSVLALHLPRDGYSFGYFANDTENEALSRFNRIREELDLRAQTSHRLILNGGDRHWPDHSITGSVELLSKNTSFMVKHSTLPQYIQAVKEEILNQQSTIDNQQSLPVIDGETRFGLKHAFAVVGGTASSRMYVKQANYECQRLLQWVVEPLNAMNVLAGNKSRNDLIRHAWRMLLHNQEHDVICGTSIDSVYREAMVRFKKVRELGETVARLVLEELVNPHPSNPLSQTGRAERESVDDRSLVFLNPLPYERTEIVECTVDFHIKDIVIGINPDAKERERTPAVAGFRLTNHEGSEVRFQILSREEAYGLLPSRHSYPRQLLVDRFKLLVEAPLASCGLISIHVERADAFETFRSPFSIGERSIENKFVSVEVDQSGLLSIRRKDGRQRFDGLNCYEDGGDVGDEYSYCFPNEDKVVRSTDFQASIEIVEHGPLRATITIATTMIVPSSASDDLASRSTSTTDLMLRTFVSLTANSPRVDIRTEVQNTAKDHRLRAVFPTGLQTNISNADAQFAIVRREHRSFDWDDYPIEKPLNLEVMQRFVTVQDDTKALTLLTRGLPEYELATDGTGLLALTLLRCVGELSRSNLTTRPGGDAGWKNSTPEAQYPGKHVFEYSILVHQPSDSFEEVLREAQSYHTPVSVIGIKERVDAEMSFLKLRSERTELTCLKEAEDGEGVIVRISNPTGIEEEVRFAVADAVSIQRTHLDESVIADISVDKGLCPLTVDPYQIQTMRVR